MPVYRADTALMAALCAIMRHAAQELGQWKMKSETVRSLDVSAISDAAKSTIRPDNLV